jgi:hypothetical protein
MMITFMIDLLISMRAGLSKSRRLAFDKPRTQLISLFHQVW